MADRPFTPSDYLEKIGDKPYLNPRKAITWFYSDHPLPEGRIIPVLISSAPIIFRADIYVNDVLVATGHADADNNSKTLRKIESAAIRRGLANAGYGTEQALKRLVQEVASRTTVEEKKDKLGSSGNRRVGTKEKQPAPETAPQTDEKAVSSDLPVSEVLPQPEPEKAAPVPYKPDLDKLVFDARDGGVTTKSEERFNTVKNMIENGELKGCESHEEALALVIKRLMGHREPKPDKKTEKVEQPAFPDVPGASAAAINFNHD